MHPSMFRGPTDEQMRDAVRFAGCAMVSVLLAVFAVGFLVGRIAR